MPTFEVSAPRPVTGFKDPAPLGGSFVFDFVDDPSPRISQTMPVVDPGNPTRAAEPVESPQERDAAKTPKFMQATVMGACGVIVGLLAESLQEESATGWRAFWRANIDEFAGLFRFVGKHVKPLTTKHQKHADDVDDMVLKKFPEAKDELGFLRAMVEDASAEASCFEPISDEQGDDACDEDFKLAGRYRFYRSMFLMCLITLDYLVHRDLEVPPAIVKAVFADARSSAFEINHAVREAARLRDQSASTEDFLAHVVHGEAV